MAVSPASVGDSPDKRGFLGGFDRFTLALALISALGAALALARQAVWGAALHADSVFYINAARNLLAGEVFQVLYADGRVGALIHWPPLYPLALALPGIFGIDARGAAGPMNALAFGLTAFVVGRWALRRLESKALALWGCAAVALAAPLADMASWALTETPFILLSTLALIAADDFLRDGRRSALILAAALSALAWLTRYIGYALIGAILALAALRSGAALRDRARDALIYGAVAALPMALWLLRNILLDGTLIGTRRQPQTELSEVADGVASFVVGWFAPDFLADRFPLLAPLMAAIVAGALCAGAARALVSSRGAAWGGRRSLAVFAAFTAVYTACVLYSLFAIPTPHYDRYWVVIYIPALAVALLVMDRLASVRGGERRVFADIRAWVEKRPARLSSLALAATLALWLALGAAQNAERIWRTNAESVRNSYNAEWWTNSETLEYLRENPVNGRIISNKTHMVYIHADAGGAYGSLPEFSVTTANASLDEVLDDAIQKSGGGAIRVVWLSIWYQNDEASYGVEALHASPRLEAEAELADGVVFRVKTDGGARPEGDIPANDAPEPP